MREALIYQDNGQECRVFMVLIKCSLDIIKGSFFVLSLDIVADFKKACINVCLFFSSPKESRTSRERKIIKEKIGKVYSAANSIRCVGTAQFLC